MARKLSDEEFVERTRANNRRRAERQRQRKMEDGRSALTVWLPVGVRQSFVQEATREGVTISDLATRLLSAALLLDGLAYRHGMANSATSRNPVDTLPLFDTAVALEPPVDRLERILALKREQPDLSNYAIAAQVGCSEPTVRRALKRLKAEATG